MKKFSAILLTAVICSAVSVNAQTKISEYRSSYYNRDFYVEVGSMDSDGDYRYFIEIPVSHDSIDEINLRMYQFTAENFTESLEEAKEKYLEWIDVASNNNVEYVNKAMDISFPDISVGFNHSYYGWDFYSADVNAYFRVQDGRPLLVIEGKTESDEFEDYSLTFASADDVDSFIAALSPAIAEKHFGESLKAQRLYPTNTANNSSYHAAANYRMAYFDRDYEIMRSFLNNNYSLEVASGDNYMPYVYIDIEDGTAFIEAVNKSKDYYVRWAKKAQEQNITDLDINIPVAFPAIDGKFIYDEDMYMNDKDYTATTIYPRFRVMDGKYMLILTGSPIITYYVDCDGFFIVFESVEEINSFVKNFKEAKISEDTLFN